MNAPIAEQRLVSELLPMDEAIVVMRRALTMPAEGGGVMPLRRVRVFSLPVATADTAVTGARHFGSAVED